MSTHHDTIRALIGALVANRYYPSTLPQQTTAPTWPQIRGTIVSRDNAIDQCGAGEHDEEDIRLQLDIFDRTYNLADDLAIDVEMALAAANPPWIRQPGGFEVFDDEAKVHRFTRDWILYQSSS